MKAAAGRGWHLLILAAMSALSASAIAQTGARVVRASGWVAPDGQIQTGCVLVISEGRITQVGGDAPADAVVDDYDVAVVCAGLIDIYSSLGASGSLIEPATALQPAVNAADAFNRFPEQMYAAMRAGVTTFALLPDDRNVIGGRGALCRAATEQGRPALWDIGGPLKLSIAPAALTPTQNQSSPLFGTREPTSRSRALGMLREALDTARTAGGAAGDPVKAATARELTAFIDAPTGADALAAAALAEEFKLDLVVVHQADPRGVAGELARTCRGVIVGPFDLGTPPRQTQAPGLYERAGLKVAIAGGLPGAATDSLRIGAAVAARDGMSPAAARRAITAVPAELLGLGERVGTIAQDREADLVVFSGDPLDLRSRVLAVYVGGERVYRVTDE